MSPDKFLTADDLTTLAAIITDLVHTERPIRYQLTANEAAFFREVYGRTMLTGRAAIAIDANDRLHRL